MNISNLFIQFWIINVYWIIQQFGDELQHLHSSGGRDILTLFITKKCFACHNEYSRIPIIGWQCRYFYYPFILCLIWNCLFGLHETVDVWFALFAGYLIDRLILLENLLSPSIRVIEIAEQIFKRFYCIGVYVSFNEIIDNLKERQSSESREYEGSPESATRMHPKRKSRSNPNSPFRLEKTNFEFENIKRSGDNEAMDSGDNLRAGGDYGNGIEVANYQNKSNLNDYDLEQNIATIMNMRIDEEEIGSNGDIEDLRMDDQENKDD